MTMEELKALSDRFADVMKRGDPGEDAWQKELAGVLDDIVAAHTPTSGLAMPELIAAALTAQCDCTVSERDSGHKVGCWMPGLIDAIDKAKGGAA